MNEVSIYEYKKKIKLWYPSADIDILEYNGMKKFIKVRCKKCGKIFTFNKGVSLFSRINFCCSKDFCNLKEKVAYFSKLYNFDVLKEDAHFITTRCRDCRNVNTRSMTAFKMFPNACSCRYQGVVKKQSELQKRLDEFFENEYQLISSNGANGECSIRHKHCGTVFEVKCFMDLINKRNRGCPNCYRFVSRGEKAIKDYLEQNKIDYIAQKSFSPIEGHIYRFDFFLPKYNLAIEYQGEQHYRNNGYYKDDLDTIKYRDEIKKEYCENNNINLLEISYTDFKNISKILSLRLNDYPTGVRNNPEKDN